MLNKISEIEKLEKLAKLVRYFILKMTTEAGSGHATSSLSATDLVVSLFFEKLRFDLSDSQNPNNDRVIFSKGHASPLLYALYGAARPQRLSDSDGGQAGVLQEKELLSYRKFGSPLEGHPTPKFKFVEAATGSLGQGLSIGLGMALAAKLDRLPYITYVLMGDGEMAEGSIWEAIAIASHYKLGNLVGIIDVNRLGQSGETMLGWDTDTYRRRVEAFGWKAYVIDGHDFDEITKTFDEIDGSGDQPVAIIAKTIKGKGVSFLENKEGWHGKALSREEFEKAVLELGEVDQSVRGEIEKPDKLKIESGNLRVENFNGKEKFSILNSQFSTYKIGEMVATRKAYGEAIAQLGESNSDIVCLDGEVKNSTFAEIFKDKNPERFFEMFIAEQNMVGAALGLSKRGKIPFVSTFAVFFSRAFDQIRMSAYSNANIKFVGSHAGVSIGEDGPSQMGLEDLAMFKVITGSTVMCPADAVACEKLVGIAAKTDGIFYIRTARPATPVIYGNAEEFKIGGSKVLRSTNADKLTIVACGVCVPESQKAAEELSLVGVNVRVIDAYSIKPIDEETLRKAAGETNNLMVTVEDHYFEGGLGDSVLNVFAKDSQVQIHKLAVSKMPVSGKGEELLDYEGISAAAIFKKIKELV